jgi:sensor c-di-GMP phosphodiesterase-like protein
MASPQQERLTPKQQALRDLEYARASLAHHAVHAAEEWSPKAILTRSVEKHRALWIGGAAVAGLAVLKAVWPSRRTHLQPEPSLSGAQRSGLFALLLSPLLGLARKSLMNYGSQMFQSYLHQKISPNAPDSEAV